MILLLPAIAVYPVLAATYIGGADIHIEGGGGGRQFTGLMLLYAVFVGVYTAIRLISLTFLAPAIAVALGLVGAGILLPLSARLTYRAVGVRITSAYVPPAQSAA